MTRGLNSQQKRYQRQYALSFGSLFAAIIAFSWTGLLVSYTAGTPRIITLAILMSLNLYALSQSLYLRFKYPITEKVSLPYMKSGSFWLKFYGVILAEIAAIFFIIQILDRHHLQIGTIPLIVFIVGAHFYPLAYWNGNKLWYLTSSLLCLGVAALVIVCPPQATTHILGATASIWELVSAGLMVGVMLLTSFVGGLMYKRSVRNS